jgi:hypothetical protein
VYQWCGFKSRRGKNKNLTALKSYSNTVWFNFQTYIYIYIYRVKPAHVVTSIKQSPEFKATFSCPVIKDFIWIEPLLRGHLSYKVTFYLSQKWPLNTGLTVYKLQVQAAIFLWLNHNILLIVVCPFVLFLLAIVLSVLRYTDSDCPFWYLQTLLKQVR